MRYMELVPLKCNKCGTEFLALVRDGEVKCPNCGAVDQITIEER